MILRITTIVMVTLLLVSVLFAGIVLLSPMGSGDIKRGKELAHDLLTMSSDQLAKKYCCSYSLINCEDGMLTVISQNSHASWWGGNLVVKTEDNTCIIYTGHVCGPSYPQSLHFGMELDSQYFGYPLLVADFIYQLDEKMQRYTEKSDDEASKQ